MMTTFSQMIFLLQSIWAIGYHIIGAQQQATVVADRLPFPQQPKSSTLVNRSRSILAIEKITQFHVCWREDAYLLFHVIIIFRLQNPSGSFVNRIIWLLLAF